eukprot:1139866-Pelagomonas_calceolata.AAC.2
MGRQRHELRRPFRVSSMRFLVSRAARLEPEGHHHPSVNVIVALNLGGLGDNGKREYVWVMMGEKVMHILPTFKKAASIHGNYFEMVMPRLVLCLILGERSGISHMDGVIVLACSGLRQERDVWVSQMKIRRGSQMVPKEARLDGQNIATKLMPAFFSCEVDRMGIFRVQEAPCTLGMREGVYNIFECLGMKLSNTISGGEDDSRCPG